MQKLVYRNTFVNIVNDDLLLDRITRFDKKDNYVVIKHDKIGTLVVDKHDLKVITRNEEYFNRFEDYIDLHMEEAEKASARSRSRALILTPSRLRGLSSRVGGVRIERLAFWRLMNNGGRDNVWSILKPTDADRHIGLEIEVCSRIDESEFLSKLKSHPLARFVSLCSDGSIEPDDHHECDCDYDEDEGHSDYCSVHNQDYTVEMRVLCKESELSNVCELITHFTKDADCYVNRTCGVHVHLDMRTRDVDGCYDKLFTNLDEMYARVDSSRKGNTYCKRNTRSEFDDHDSLEDRYFAINTRSYDEHSTLEVRLHHGSIDGDEIKNWTKFLIDTVNGIVVNKQSIAV